MSYHGLRVRTCSANNDFCPVRERKLQVLVHPPRSQHGGFFLLMREAIHASTRFEILKRDNFTCQYCGAKAPEVVLHVDHIHPVADGGTNELLNLIAACQSCNLGKSDRKLSDHQKVAKQADQMRELQERREQLEMMAKWRNELSSLTEDAIDALDDVFEDTTGFPLGDRERLRVKRLLKNHDTKSLMEAMEFGIEFGVGKRDRKYYMSDENFAQVCWDGFLTAVRRSDDDAKLPGSGKIPYVRAILRNRLGGSGCDCVVLMKDALLRGATADDFIEIAKLVDNYAEFCDLVVGLAPAKVV
jgi:5-methylcytosine-specific restriction endonuclease McrA